MCFKIVYTENGFSIIEVLFAAFVLSFGVLSFLQSELIALRTIQIMRSLNIAYIKSIAFAESLKGCAGQLSCLAKQQTRWRLALKTSLPEAEFSLHVLGQTYQIEISKLAPERFKWPAVYTLRFSV